jgi:SulP family sulfate permease
VVSIEKGGRNFLTRTFGPLSAGIGDLFGGLSSSIVAIAYGLSFASLIFAPPLSPWLANGVTATFISMAVCAAIMASFSSLPFAVAGPDGATSAVTATLVAALVERLNEVGPPDDLLAPIMIVVALGTALTGGALCLLGFLRAGGAVRFIPFPVIGGFLAATGALMIGGGVRVITEHRLGFSTLGVFANPATLSKLAAAVAVALAIALVLRRSRSAFVVPAIILLAIAATHLALVLSGLSLAEAEAQGWMFSPPGDVTLTLDWDRDDLRLFPWRVLPSLLGDLAATVFVTTITMLLNTNGIEFVVRREANLQRELKAIGVANLLSAALGGYVGVTSLSRTTLNYAAGGRGRVSGFVMAVVAVGVLSVGSDFIAYIPKFALGGSLLYLGASLIHKWLIDSLRRISWLDYGLLLLVAVIIVQWGFIAGLGIGIAIGCMTFALSASRVSAIKFSFDGSEYQSSLDRGADQLAILSAHSHEIQGVILHSYLFFGSANHLYEHVKHLFGRRRGYRFLVFDFRLVTGMDSSAMHSFTQIKHAAGEAGATLVLVNLTPEIRRNFTQLVTADDIVADDLDRALELCENAIVEAHSNQDREGRDLSGWLTQALGSAEYAEQLAQCCERLEVGAGEIIATQGEPADSMHFIVSGRVGIVVTLEGGVSSRVRSLGSHTTIGEMGLITGKLRSATIQAEADSVLYVLSRTAFDRLNRDNHALSQALLTYVVSVMAERLRFASNLIGVLRR